MEKPLGNLLNEMLNERKHLLELGKSCFSKEPATAYSTRYDALEAKGLEENPLQERKKRKKALQRRVKCAVFWIALGPQVANPAFCGRLEYSVYQQYCGIGN